MRASFHARYASGRGSSGCSRKTAGFSLAFRRGDGRVDSQGPPADACSVRNSSDSRACCRSWLCVSAGIAVSEAAETWSSVGVGSRAASSCGASATGRRFAGGWGGADGVSGVMARSLGRVGGAAGARRRELWPSKPRRSARRNAWASCLNRLRCGSPGYATVRAVRDSWLSLVLAEAILRWPAAAACGRGRRNLRLRYRQTRTSQGTTGGDMPREGIIPGAG